MKISRRTYADHYGPTAGDRIRLADTDLIVRVERDLTVPGVYLSIARRRRNPSILNL